MPMLEPGSSTTSPVAFLVSDAANPQFSACQPDSWNDEDPARQFHFSPAVCPSDWTYYSVRRIFPTAASQKDHSTAYCCARFVHEHPRLHFQTGSLIRSHNFSGYDLWDTWLDFPITSLARPCYQYIEAGATRITIPIESSGTGTTRVFKKGYMAHEAWAISWAAENTAGMSPALPALDSVHDIATWVPGQSVTSFPQPKSQNDSVLVGLGKFYYIGLPLICVAALAGGICCCITVRRSKRREAAKLEQWRLEHPTGMFRTTSR
ncbi:hypothetical protein N7457_003635 [Penicillium paradoxum]|uniref:uncharacterized protein n=1 Tax=Penicillium paradoxum TaxID=176176 RepID=UPI00254878DE|nr:uncharacterized protein N7457_003635 [Penicillium paradoxum]KAJ5788645.1 hypothetical protein N7457_003635 [Penicillium paradoxum]